VFEHISEFGSGWMPIGGHGLAEGVRNLHELVAGAGRDPGALEVIPFTNGAADHAKVDALARAGATEIAFDISEKDESVIRRCSS
jgi:hypothetical protein